MTFAKRRFNGAAAKSSGKYFAHLLKLRLHSRASMGPPLKAAENPNVAPDLGLGRDASMGPPLKAAENATETPAPAPAATSLQWGRR